jgi:hypothetical protein
LVRANSLSPSCEPNEKQSVLRQLSICKDYLAKEWCGLEWRAIRDIIKQRRDATVMLLRLDQAQLPVVRYRWLHDVSTWTPAKTAETIVKRLRSNDASGRQTG